MLKVDKSKVLALLTLTSLITSLLLACMNSPVSGQQPDIYLHGPSVVPIHMHGPSLVPIHMHSTVGTIDLSNPWEILWHELYPEYCQEWIFTSWEDNGNQYLDTCDQIDMTNIDTSEVRWYHVDRVTMTLRLWTNYWGFDEEIYVEYKGPYDPYIQPVCTNWTEVWPVYLGVTGGPYHIIWWEDNGNGYLDWCDYIYFEDWPEVWWHVEEFATDLILNEKVMDPIGIEWHELYPSYCNWHTLTSWEEPLEDPYPGRLSPGDQIDMINETSGITKWYFVDRVTFTLLVSSVSEPLEEMFIEYKGPFETMYEVKTDPLNSSWHEVYPLYCNVYNITDWKDNCNGVLDFCDYIELVDAYADMYYGWWHVEELAIDIILNEKIMDPVCTYWHELYPECCVNDYHIEGWEDNGDKLLSPCDNVTMMLMPDGLLEEYHVEEVTLALNLTILDWTGPVPPGDRIYVEFTGGYEWMYYAKIYPLDTEWHEVCPEFCEFFYLTDWKDNCNGVLSYCDLIVMYNPQLDQYLWCHIADVAIDITVKKITVQLVHDVAVTHVSSLYPWVYQGQIDPIQVTFINEGDYTETIDIFAFYDGNLAAPKQTIIAGPGEGTTLTFNWDTTGVPPGIYTISANATISVDDDPADNILVDGTQEVRLMPQLYWKESHRDYAPSGMPDFDQRQDQWDNPPGSTMWSWCAPTAVANSLWWYDSKYEPNTVPPPAMIDNYPLVTSYNPGVWDDHDPQNVQPFIQHLAYLMDTDGQRTGVGHFGTWVFDMEAGIAQYLSWTGVNPLGDCNGDGTVNQTDLQIVQNALGTKPGQLGWNMAADIWPITLGWPGVADNIVDNNDLNLVQANMGLRGTFYEHTVLIPEFSFIEEEIERCEDVILMLGFWNYDSVTQEWYREEYPYPTGSGHCVTAAGVNSTSMLIGISDPIQDNAEPPPHGTKGPGRVFPSPPHPHPPIPPDTVHNDASYISHDVYNVAPSPCPAGNCILVNYTSPQHPGWNTTLIEWAVIVSPLPTHDVSVLDVTSLYPWVYQGQIDPIDVTVKNEGDFTETVDVYAFYDGNLAAPKQTTTLNPGENKMLTFNWDTTGVPPGFYTVSANATISVDDDPADNVKTGNQQEVREPPTEIHDVAVTNVTTSKTVVGQGFSMDVNVTVENQGDVTETFNVTMYYDTSSIGTQEVTLASGFSDTVTFSWNTTGVAYGNYTISAYAHPVLGEIDTADNSLADGTVKVTIPGDINGDCKVDWRDLKILAMAYGSSEGDPRYVAEADYNGDGTINWKDLKVLALNYGKTC